MEQPFPIAITQPRLNVVVSTMKCVKNKVKLSEVYVDEYLTETDEEDDDH
jgi:hypothetical protein